MDSLAKVSTIHLAAALASDLADYTITLTPGYLRSEVMLELFGVSEENWWEGAAADPHFLASESPAFIGEAVNLLALD